MRRAITATGGYALAAAILGAAAPVGFWILERLAGRRRGRRLAYCYMAVATPIVFAAFGAVLGRRRTSLARIHVQLERLRDEFLAVAAHDLRNPIQTIELQVESLLRKAEGDEVAVPVESLRRLERAGGRLASMVDDLLDASRIEASRLSLDPEMLDVAAMVRDVLQRISPNLGKHPVELVGETAYAPVDRARLDQVITNLVDNAAKYSAPDAPITIRVEQGEGAVYLLVEDHGAGIPPEELPRLFNRFYQTQRARALRTGLGLGLYIVRGIVEAHGGSVGVASEVGRGSTFTVSLPCRSRPEEPHQG